MTLDDITAHLDKKAVDNVHARLEEVFHPVLQSIPNNLVVSIRHGRRDAGNVILEVRSAVFEAMIDAERKRVTAAFVAAVEQFEPAAPRLEPSIHPPTP